MWIYSIFFSWCFIYNSANYIWSCSIFYINITNSFIINWKMNFSYPFSITYDISEIPLIIYITFLFLAAVNTIFWKTNIFWFIRNYKIIDCSIRYRNIYRFCSFFISIKKFPNGIIFTINTFNSVFGLFKNRISYIIVFLLQLIVINKNINAEI